MKNIYSWWIIAAALLAASGPALAAPPWGGFMPFRKVTVDPRADYSLTEEHGPWLILAHTFAGPTAEADAKELVLELRQRYKLTAYIHKQSYDYTQTEVGLGYDKYGNRKRMRPLHATSYEGYAVLVGDFSSVDQPGVDRALEKIRYAKPHCFNNDLRTPEGDLSPVAVKMAAFREKQEKAKRYLLGENYEEQGPLGKAFVTRNPILPEEFFAPKGLDPLVRDMNKGVEHSLLNCPGKYTVRIATFRGQTTLNSRPEDIAKFEQSISSYSRSKKMSPLEEAALKAHKLATHLREQGVEAYEFHDRHESMVTVGSFETVGQQRLDGKTEIDPAVHRVMEQYSAQKQGGFHELGQAEYAMVPRQIVGVMLDPQPVPVAVPKESIGQDYVRRP